jgi:hypothetical protein
MQKSASDNSTWVGYGSKTKLRLQSGMKMPCRLIATRLTRMSIFAAQPDSFAVEVTQSQMTILFVDLWNAIACSAPALVG